MNVYSLLISEVKIIQPDVHEDKRGYLAVPVSILQLKNAGIDFNIVQINQGFSYNAHTMRGMHFQKAPYEQAKLISANAGSFYSVAVDIRKDSNTFGQWCGEVISADNHRIMYIPKGFAHGYLTLEDNTVMQYCVDNEYNAEAATALKFDDSKVGIIWPEEVIKELISDKDINAVSLDEI